MDAPIVNVRVNIESLVYNIRGSWGDFKVAYDGTIIERFEDECDECDLIDGRHPYADMVRFDLDEYRAWALAADIPYANDDERHPVNHTDLDILEVALWNDEGDYEPAESTFRDDYVAAVNGGEFE